jgi:hypothetical protein
MPDTPACGRRAGQTLHASTPGNTLTTITPPNGRRISPSGGIVRGKFPSRKNARMVHHRGLLELDAIYLFETSPLIANFQERPGALSYPHGARLRRYTPAFELLLRSGETIMVEVMYADGLKEAPRRERLDHIESHLRRLGVNFAVLTDDVVRLEPRLSTLKGIYRLALQRQALDPQTHRGPPSAAAAAVATASIAACLPAPLDALPPLLAPTGINAFSLLLGGFLRCSLDAPVGPSTTVHLSKEIAHDWFHVSQAHGF